MLILSYNYYSYYDPCITLEWADGRALENYEQTYFKGKDEGFTHWGDGDAQYFKITNENQLIKALKYLLEEDIVMSDEYEVETEDLIKLLRDKNLGQTFFQRFVQNAKWLYDRRDLRDKILKYPGNYDYRNELLILDGKTPVYLVKDNLELQKMILTYCFNKNIKFQNEWFDIQEKDIQEWRHETEVSKLKQALIDKQEILIATQKHIIRLKQEILDLQEKIKETEGA